MQVPTNRIRSASSHPREGRVPDTGFVAYLRRAFQWGGFPGWASYGSPLSDASAAALPADADEAALARYIQIIFSGLWVEAAAGASSAELKEAAERALANWPSRGG